MTLGEKIYGLRKNSGLSQEQLAEILNVSRQSISKWEGNVTYPEPDKLIALSDYFQVSLDYLMKAEVTEDRSEGKGIVAESTSKVAGSEMNPAETCTEDQSREQNVYRAKTSSPMLAGLTICLAAVIGLVFYGVLILTAPEASQQMGESSMITLNGTALVLVFLFGLLVLGIALIIRSIRRKS